MATGFAVMTEQEKAEMVAKAQAARAAYAAARKASTLRRDFADSPVWDELAREHGLRLPPWGTAPTVSRMRTFLNKVGKSQGWCEEWLGCKLARFSEFNPDWPARALAGLILEEVTASPTTTA